VTYIRPDTRLQLTTSTDRRRQRRLKRVQDCLSPLQESKLPRRGFPRYLPLIRQCPDQLDILPRGPDRSRILRLFRHVEHKFSRCFLEGRSSNYTLAIHSERSLGSYGIITYLIALKGNGGAVSAKMCQNERFSKRLLSWKSSAGLLPSCSTSSETGVSNGWPAYRGRVSHSATICGTI
jgi:hypothetical protein